MQWPTILLAASSSLVAASPGGAQEIPSHPLTGVYRAEPCADAPDRICRYFLEFRGDTARALYDGMRSAAETDACTGGEVKIDADTLRCFRLGEGDYLCDFGYDFEEKKFIFGDVTC
jgi:hypothetical protein